MISNSSLKTVKLQFPYEQNMYLEILQIHGQIYT